MIVTVKVLLNAAKHNGGGVPANTLMSKSVKESDRYVMKEVYLISKWNHYL